MNGTKAITFRTVAQQSGIGIEEPFHLEYPLQAWFASVYDKPLDSLSEGDLARAIRQQLFLEYVVPICLQLLSKDPLAGEYYEGELLQALQSVPSKYWLQHVHMRQLLQGIVKTVYNNTNDRELQQELNNLEAKLRFVS